jgi:coenzyme PQQ precursor peptide PqqA
VHVSFSAIVGRRPDGFGKESTMAWKTPKIVEVPVGMEINMYACAARK